MKKFAVGTILIALCTVLCLGFVGCSKPQELPKDNELPNLPDAEIGTQFTVYPTVSFNYQIEEGFVIHFDSITATLVEKNEIEENGTIIDERYYPYVVEIKIIGSTDAKHAGKEIYIDIAAAAMYSALTTIKEDGTISATINIKILRATNFTFAKVKIR